MQRRIIMNNKLRICARITDEYGDVCVCVFKSRNKSSSTNPTTNNFNQVQQINRTFITQFMDCVKVNIKLARFEMRMEIATEKQ